MFNFLLYCSWKSGKSSSVQPLSTVLKMLQLSLMFQPVSWDFVLSFKILLSLLFVVVISLLKLFYLNLKINSQILEPNLFKLHWDFGQSFFLSSISSMTSIFRFSLLSLQTLFLPPFPSLALSFPLSIPLFLHPSWLYGLRTYCVLDIIVRA